MKLLVFAHMHSILFYNQGPIVHGHPSQRDFFQVIVIRYLILDG